MKTAAAASLSGSSPHVHRPQGSSSPQCPSTVKTLPPLASSLVRLAAELLILLLWTQLSHILSRKKHSAITLLTAYKVLRQEKLFAKLFCAMFFGTFIAIWLQQLSVKFTSAGIAQTLFATCPPIGTVLACIFH